MCLHSHSSKPETSWLMLRQDRKLGTISTKETTHGGKKVPVVLIPEVFYIIGTIQSLLQNLLDITCQGILGIS